MDLVDCVHTDETVTVSDAGSLRGRCAGHGSVGMGLASLVGFLQFCKHVRAYFVAIKGCVVWCSQSRYKATWQAPMGSSLHSLHAHALLTLHFEKRNASPEHIRAAW